MSIPGSIHSTQIEGVCTSALQGAKEIHNTHKQEMLLTLSDFSKVNPELENISNRALHFEKC
jgi:hypothetical protein